MEGMGDQWGMETKGDVNGGNQWGKSMGDEINRDINGVVNGG